MLVCCAQHRDDLPWERRQRVRQWALFLCVGDVQLDGVRSLNLHRHWVRTRCICCEPVWGEPNRLHAKQCDELSRRVCSKLQFDHKQLPDCKQQSNSVGLKVCERRISGHWPRRARRWCAPCCGIPRVAVRLSLTVVAYRRVADTLRWTCSAASEACVMRLPSVCICNFRTHCNGNAVFKVSCFFLINIRIRWA